MNEKSCHFIQKSEDDFEISDIPPLTKKSLLCSGFLRLN